jgi:hypothetical protein
MLIVAGLGVAAASEIGFVWATMEPTNITANASHFIVTSLELNES